MTDKNDMIRQVEELLGPEGGLEIAARAFDNLREIGAITFDPARGFAFSEAWKAADSDIWSSLALEYGREPRVFQVGDRVEAGMTPEDYDAGRVLKLNVDGTIGISVGWDSGVKTVEDADWLRPEGTAVFRKKTEQL